MKKLVNIANKSAKNASQLMAMDIRQSAAQSGWKEDVAQTINVSYTTGRYKVSVPKKLEGQALDLEYGTTRSRPTAVLRKYANDTSKIEKSIINGMEKDLGWKL
jgi:hypothetical protein